MDTEAVRETIESIIIGARDSRWDEHRETRELKDLYQSLTPEERKKFWYVGSTIVHGQNEGYASFLHLAQDYLDSDFLGFLKESFTSSYYDDYCKTQILAALNSTGDRESGQWTEEFLKEKRLRDFGTRFVMGLAQANPAYFLKKYPDYWIEISLIREFNSFEKFYFGQEFCQLASINFSLAEEVARQLSVRDSFAAQFLKDGIEIFLNKKKPEDVRNFHEMPDMQRILDLLEPGTAG